jgi:hypothetical protein
MTLVMTLAAVIAATAAVLLAITPIVDAHRRAVLRRVVRDTCRIFDAHDVDYWCDFGTLLGFYRERDIISGDKDADFSIMDPEKVRIMALVDVFRANGYELTDCGGRARKVIRIYEAKTRYYVDVYPYVADGTVLRSVLASPQEDIPAHLVARRRPASFLGARMLVPDDVPAMLRHRYGPAFNTPRRGDKGTARPYSAIRSILEDLQDNLLGIVAWLREGVHREPVSSQRDRSPQRHRDTGI